MPAPRQPISPEAAFARAAARCATTEYCKADWQRKLAAMGLTPEAVAEVLRRLVAEGFIDEGRYARAYAHDKAAYERWGALKIRQGLLQKHIPAELADEALATVDEDLWAENLAVLLQRKNRSLKAASDYERRQKLLRFAAGRGYGPEVIYDAVDQCCRVDEP